MSFPIITNYILHTIWLIIPLRQIKTNFFPYFLIYAFLSVFMLFDYILLIHPAYVYLGSGFFLIISLFRFRKIPHYKLFLAGAIIISVILPFLLSVSLITFCLIFEHIIIFLIILKRTILYSGREEKLNIFHFVLLFYEITIITRFIVVMGDIKTALIIFYFTAAFGIIIGIFFLKYNENNSPKFYLK